MGLSGLGPLTCGVGGLFLPTRRANGFVPASRPTLRAMSLPRIQIWCSASNSAVRPSEVSEAAEICRTLTGPKNEGDVSLDRSPVLAWLQIIPWRRCRAGQQRFFYSTQERLRTRPAGSDAQIFVEPIVALRAEQSVAAGRLLYSLLTPFSSTLFAAPCTTPDERVESRK
jgi:hypothetical protein